jgi:4-deoxy-L-threo-5-hexosulose-uronate ketol-isomerase
MGFTEMPKGVWNTMPPHTHERRMEVYLHDFPRPPACFTDGKADQTRHIVVAPKQGVICRAGRFTAESARRPIPSAGGGRRNQTFDDMDHRSVIEIRSMKPQINRFTD